MSTAVVSVLWAASLQLEQEIEEIREEFKHIPVPDDKHTRKGFEDTQLLS